jgi:hypothetical protein
MSLPTSVSVIGSPVTVYLRRPSSDWLRAILTTKPCCGVWVRRTPSFLGQRVNCFNLVTWIDGNKLLVFGRRSRRETAEHSQVQGLVDISHHAETVAERSKSPDMDRFLESAPLRTDEVVWDS